jgi:hypothetical protein
VATNIGDLLLRITADASGVSNSLNEVKGQLSSFSSMAKGIIAGISLDKIFDTTIKSNATFEQYRTSFEVLMGSADKAKQHMESLNKFAAETPFELLGIIQASQQLETYGLKTETYLKVAGNTASAFGKQITDVTSALGKLASGNTGEGLERLRDFGITSKQLAEQKITFDKGGSLTSSVKQTMEAVVNIMNQKYSGMMDKQSQTANGLFSTLKDNLSAFGRQIGEQTFDLLKVKLQSFMALFQQWGNDGTLKAISNKLSEGFIGVVNTIQVAINFIVTYKSQIASLVGVYIAVTTALKVAATAQSVFNAVAMMNPYVAVAAALIGLAGAVWGYKAANDALKTSTEDVQKQHDTLSTSIEKLTTDYQNLAIVESQMGTYNKNSGYEEAMKKIDAYQKRIDNLKDYQAELDKLNGVNADAPPTQNVAIDQLNAKIDELKGKYKDVIDLNNKFNDASNIAKQKQKIESTIKESQAIQDNTTSYEALYNKIRSGQPLNQQEINANNKMIAQYPQYKTVLNEKTGAIGIDIQALGSQKSATEILAKAEFASYQASMSQQASKTSQIIENTKTRITAINTEIEANNKLAIALGGSGTSEQASFAFKPGVGPNSNSPTGDPFRDAISGIAKKNNTELKQQSATAQAELDKLNNLYAAQKGASDLTYEQYSSQYTPSSSGSSSDPYSNLDNSPRGSSGKSSRDKVGEAGKTAQEIAAEEARIAEEAKQKEEDDRQTYLNNYIRDNITAKKAVGELTLEAEENQWKYVRNNLSKTTEEQQQADQAIYQNKKDKFEDEVKDIETKKSLGKINADEEIALYKNLLNNKAYDEETKTKLTLTLRQKILDNSKTWIDEEKQYNNMSLEEEKSAWTRVYENQKDNIEAVKTATQELYRIKREEIQNTLELQKEESSFNSIILSQTKKDSYISDKGDGTPKYNDTSFDKALALSNDVVNNMKIKYGIGGSFSDSDMSKQSNAIMENIKKVGDFKKSDVDSFIDNYLKEIKKPFTEIDKAILLELNRSATDKDLFGFHEAKPIDEVIVKDKIAKILSTPFDQIKSEMNQNISDIATYYKSAIETKKNTPTDLFNWRTNNSNKWITNQTNNGLLDEAGTKEAYDRMIKYHQQYLNEIKKSTTMSEVEKYAEENRVTQLIVDLNVKKYKLYVDALKANIKNEYDIQQEKIKKDQQLDKEALEEKKTTIKELYEAKVESIDKEKALYDETIIADNRSKELGELEIKKQLYLNAATKEGKEKLADIIKQMNTINADIEKDAKNKEFTARKEKLKADYDINVKEYEDKQKADDLAYGNKLTKLQQNYDNENKATETYVTQNVSILESGQIVFSDKLETIFKTNNDNIQKIKNLGIGYLDEILKKYNETMEVMSKVRIDPGINNVDISASKYRDTIMSGIYKKNKGYDATQELLNKLKINNNYNTQTNNITVNDSVSANILSNEIGVNFYKG